MSANFVITKEWDIFENKEIKDDRNEHQGEGPVLFVPGEPMEPAAEGASVLRYTRADYGHGSFPLTVYRIKTTTDAGKIVSTSAVAEKCRR